MSVRNLDRIFRPRRIAVIGASEDASKVGARVLSNLVQSDYRGVVTPVNARRESVQGVRAYSSVAALPDVPDLAILCTPAATVAGLVKECGEAGVRGLIINTAGFGETGEEGRRLERELGDVVASFDGMRVVGPNCLGVLVPGLGLNASFAGALPPGGRLAFISQSGAVCTAVLDWAIEQGVGFSHFVSVGNMLDVGFADLIDYFGQDPETRAILLYIESVKNAREFMSAARAFARSKPIVAYKAGRFQESAAAAASHTGAMAGDDAVFDAAARRAGIERVFELEDLFDCAELLAYHKPPRLRRLAIVTNAGGPGVMATDALLARDGRLAELSSETMSRLDTLLPAAWSRGNPVDVLGDADSERYASALRVVLDDPGVDAVLVLLAPQAMTDATTTARAVAALSSATPKSLLAAWMGGASVSEGRRLLGEASIATYSTPEQGINAYMHLASYSRNLETLYETPRELEVDLPDDRSRLTERSRAILARGPEMLSEIDAKELLATYRIRVTPTRPATTRDHAIRLAAATGYPVVLKVLSPDITHKTDVGGVRVGLRDHVEVGAAWDEIMSAAKAAFPEARLDGVSVQPSLPTSQGVELILGSKTDATFGAVIMVGMGGVSAELDRDFTLGLPPLNERLARRMLESLRSYPLLRGYRNRPPMALDRLVNTLVRFSYLVADHPEIREIDINPLLVTADTAVALDARIAADPEALANPPAPFSHLAIRPYPEQFIRPASLRDGQPVLLRPIRPEDEPLWHQLLSSCSAESVRMRFFTLIEKFSHEMASRYCFNDYDREMAIVAELEGDGERRLLGVGRLVADPDHESAEFAVLIGDSHHGLGLGKLLTEYCLEIAESWGISWVYATTLLENRRMIAILRDQGFETKSDLEDGLVYGRKVLKRGQLQDPPGWDRVRAKA